MPTYHIIEVVTERRQYLVNADGLSDAQDFITEGRVLPQGVRETSRETVLAREVADPTTVDLR